MWSLYFKTANSITKRSWQWIKGDGLKLEAVLTWDEFKIRDGLRLEVALQHMYTESGLTLDALII